MKQLCLFWAWLLLATGGSYAQSWGHDSVPLVFHAQLVDGGHIASQHGGRIYLAELTPNRIWSTDLTGKALAQLDLSQQPDVPKTFPKSLLATQTGLYFSFGGGNFYHVKSDLSRLAAERFPIRNATNGFTHHVLGDIAPFLVVEKPTGTTYLLPVRTEPNPRHSLPAHWDRSFYRQGGLAVLSKNEPLRFIVPRDPIFQEKLVPWSVGQWATWVKNGRLAVGDAASHLIRTYDLAGHPLGSFGQPGRALTARDTIPWVPYPPTTLDSVAIKALSSKMRKIDGVMYHELFYDAEQDLLYRFYLASHFEQATGPYYVQVYKGERLVADLTFPANRYRVFAAAQGELWALYNDEERAAPTAIHRFKLKLP